MTASTTVNNQACKCNEYADETMKFLKLYQVYYSRTKSLLYSLWRGGI